MKFVFVSFFQAWRILSIIIYYIQKWRKKNKKHFLLQNKYFGNSLNASYSILSRCFSVSLGVAAHQIASHIRSTHFTNRATIEYLNKGECICIRLYLQFSETDVHCGCGMTWYIYTFLKSKAILDIQFYWIFAQKWKHSH